MILELHSVMIDGILTPDLIFDIAPDVDRILVVLQELFVLSHLQQTFVALGIVRDHIEEHDIILHAVQSQFYPLFGCLRFCVDWDPFHLDRVVVNRKVLISGYRFQSKRFEYHVHQSVSYQRKNQQEN